MGTVDGGLSQSKATVMYQIGWIVCSIPFLNFGAEAYTYYRQGMKLYLSPDMEIEANEIQMQHSNILVDPIMEDIEMYLGVKFRAVCKLDDSDTTGLSERSILRTQFHNDLTQYGLCPTDYRGTQ